MGLNNNLPVFSVTPKNAMLLVTSPTGVTLSTLPTGASNQILQASAQGSRVYALHASNDDGSYTPTIFIYIVSGSTAYPIGTVNLLKDAGSGTGAYTQSIDLLSFTNLPGLPIDETGRQYIELQANNYLCIAFNTNAAAGSHYYFTAQYADYQ
ncbi:MAG TPA: hypothetical protein VNY36_04165 [Bacteroidia bacterium]|jgi:hypothetical protein|nr:hypothetical protein [Bacteroidia bacterium]